MANERKVILFIVEGPTDEMALGLIFTKILREKNVFFDVMHGDITIDELFNESLKDKNILDHLSEEVCDYVSKQPYNVDDIHKIVWLTDTDGAYISENKVLAGAGDTPIYFHDHVEVPDAEFIKKRNKCKARNTKKLQSRGYITCKGKKIPLEAYYLSRNMEHALHGIEDELSDEEKADHARLFQRTYRNDIEGFLKLIHDGKLMPSGSYSQTWNFIYTGTNSLGRYTNLGLLFE